MVFHKTIVLAALLQAYVCNCQIIGTSEVINQGVVSQSYTSALPAPCSPIVIPAVIRPISDCRAPAPSPPIINNYPLCPPMLPPVIIGDDDDNDIFPLLYFLIFAMNRRGGNGCGGNGYGSGQFGFGRSCGGYCGSCDGCCGGNCGGCYGGSYCNCPSCYGNSYGCGCYSGSNCYCPCSTPVYSGTLDTPCGYDEITVIQTPSSQTTSTQYPNEINLIIRADPCSCSCS